jgi:hypothetical protein
MKSSILICLAMLAMPVFAAQTAPNERCKYVLDGAAEAHDKALKDAEERAEKVATKAKESSSCLARAGDQVIRAAIPPTLGSVLGVLNDPVGMIQGAVGNAACNVIQKGTNTVSGTAGAMNGAVRGAGQDAQRQAMEKIDQAMGGQGITRGVTPAPTPPGKSRMEELTCRIFGRC